jgi:hypothetical protein
MLFCSVKETNKTEREGGREGEIFFHKYLAKSTQMFSVSADKAKKSIQDLGFLCYVCFFAA